MWRARRRYLGRHLVDDVHAVRVSVPSDDLARHVRQVPVRLDGHDGARTERGSDDGEKPRAGADL